MLEISQPSQRGAKQSIFSGYLSHDTIAAAATALGGPVSILRVSGPLALSTLKTLTAGVASSHASEAKRFFRSKIVNPSSSLLLDDALCVAFFSPESFTGEDVVEFHLHGGAFTANSVMEALADLGVRQALPGEFSFRAVRNGKMSLSQAQAVADLIAASNDGAVTLALEKMSGSQNRLIAELSDGLRALAAMGEVGIDFADQDVEEVSLPNLKKQLEPTLLRLRRLHSSYDRGIRVQEGVRVAFIGLPNVGKSSFFNCLLGEDRSIVSDTAGTTRDVVREKLTLRGKSQTITLRLEDTAGLRHTEDRIEKLGIARSQSAAKDADLVLFLVDPTQPLSIVQEQWQSLVALGAAPKTLGILTKIDLIKKTELVQVLTELSPLGIPTWVQTSAETNEGIDEAVEAIASFCQHWTSRQKGEILLTRLDQTQAVAACLEHLHRAEVAVEIDLFAADLRHALHALGPLIGETVADDILGRIFSDFCIGK